MFMRFLSAIFNCFSARATKPPRLRGPYCIETVAGAVPPRIASAPRSRGGSAEADGLPQDPSAGSGGSPYTSHRPFRTRRNSRGEPDSVR